MNTNEDDNAPDELHEDADAITDDDDDNLICELNLNADNCRLYKAKAAHDALLETNDHTLAKKTLTATGEQHLDFKSSISKLDDVAKTVDLGVSTILAEQNKNPVPGTVRSWIRKAISPEAKSPEIHQSKGLFRNCQEFDRLLIEEEGQLLCYYEPSDKVEDEIIQICLPLSLF